MGSSGGFLGIKLTPADVPGPTFVYGDVAYSGRKIHAGTRHYAVLPLSLAVKPLKCADGARHDLLPCPDCQNISKYGEKSMSN